MAVHRRDAPDPSLFPNYFANRDGLWIFSRKWLPEQTTGSRKPAGVVLICHGYGEHSGRYDHVAQALVKAGFAVFALDHQGLL